MVYLLSPAKSFARFDELNIEIHYPKNWQIIDDLHFQWQTESIAKEQIARYKTTGDSIAKTLENNLFINFIHREPIISSGGPIIGLGGTMLDTSTFRARLGYEIGLGTEDFTLIGLMAESNFIDHLTLTPTLKVASPFIIVLPSFGFGLGAPIYLEKNYKPSYGGRVEFDIHWAPIGLTFFFDYYPKFHSALPQRDSMKQLGILFQVSF